DRYLQTGSDISIRNLASISSFFILCNWMRTGSDRRERTGTWGRTSGMCSCTGCRKTGNRPDSIERREEAVDVDCKRTGKTGRKLIEGWEWGMTSKSWNKRRSIGLCAGTGCRRRACIAARRRECCRKIRSAAGTDR
ncbi:hypothetical protein PENTCL1PPCAC_19729, partial [Pristionchus entomophagus]